MKKITSIAAVALFCALAMTSCKKEYTCTCTGYVNGSVVGSGTSSKIKDTKSNAEADCNKGDTETTVSGVTTKTECELD